MKQQDSTIHNFIRLVGIFPGKWFLVLAVTLTVILSGLVIWSAHLLKQLVDLAIDPESGSFVTILLTIGGVIITESLAMLFRTKSVGAYTEGGVRQLRMMLMERISVLPIPVITRTHSGDYVSRLTNDLNRVSTFTSQTMLNVIYRPLAALGAFVYLLVLSWKLTLLTVLLIPVIFYAGSIFSKPLGKLTKQQQEKLAEVNSVAQDAITGVEVARAYNLQPEMNAKYGSAVDKSVHFGKVIARKNAILESFSTLFSIVPYLICFGLGGYWVVQGELTAGGLIAFINLLNYLTFPLSGLPVLFGQVRSGIAAAERLFEVLDLDTERTGGEDFSGSTSDVVLEFSGVSFGYQPGEPVLRNTSLKIRQGERVAVVGASGSGKSTIMKLLTGLYDQYEGEIKLFGHSLRDWNLTSLRRKIAIVTQDPFLFPESIQENIGYGDESRPEAEIVKAAKAANAHDFISKFVQGYQTPVGELGDTLSGGQKQRISLARAILKDAPLLLLDEATSSLDLESERAVQAALDKFMEGRTTLVIAHRLSTVKNADRILVIDQGRILEEGTHEALLAADGLYAKLYSGQATSAVAV